MATPITWRNVSTTVDPAAVDLLKGANASFGSALAGITGVVKDQQGLRDRNRTTVTNNNTNTMMDALAKPTTPEEFQAAQASIEQLRGSLNNDYDRNAVRSATEARLPELQQRANAKAAFDDRQLMTEVNPLADAFRAAVVSGDAMQQAELMAKHKGLFDRGGVGDDLAIFAADYAQKTLQNTHAQTTWDNGVTDRQTRLDREALVNEFTPIADEVRGLLGAGRNTDAKALAEKHKVGLSGLALYGDLSMQISGEDEADMLKARGEDVSRSINTRPDAWAQSQAQNMDDFTTLAIDMGVTNKGGVLDFENTDAATLTRFDAAIAEAGMFSGGQSETQATQKFKEELVAQYPTMPPTEVALAVAQFESGLADKSRINASDMATIAQEEELAASSLGIANNPLYLEKDANPATAVAEAVRAEMENNEQLKEAIQNNQDAAQDIINGVSEALESGVKLEGTSTKIRLVPSDITAILMMYGADYFEEDKPVSELLQLYANRPEIRDRDESYALFEQYSTDLRNGAASRFGRGGTMQDQERSLRGALLSNTAAEAKKAEEDKAAAIAAAAQEAAYTHGQSRWQQTMEDRLKDRPAPAMGARWQTPR